MSAEMIVAASSVATFIVIAATAIAALLQLRHLRASNQLQSMLTLNEMWDSPELTAAAAYVRDQFPAKAAALSDASALPKSSDWQIHPELRICTWWEQVGAMVKHGLIEPEPFLDLAGYSIITHWDILQPTVEIYRKSLGPAVWENFEYLASISKDFAARYPNGNFPKNVRRLTIASKS